MKPLRLEELDPEVLLLHLVRHQLCVPHLHRGVGSEDGFDHFVSDTEFHGIAAIGAVRDGLQLGQEGRGKA